MVLNNNVVNKSTSPTASNGEILSEYRIENEVWEEGRDIF